MEGYDKPSHDFFDHSNAEGVKIRQKVCDMALKDMFSWIEDKVCFNFNFALTKPTNSLKYFQGEIAVFDATNTTRERRRLLYQRIVVEKGYKLFFVESICNDDTIIDSNIKEVKTASPDYTNFTEDKVLDDFKKRIDHYQERYQTLDESCESDYSFMKIFDCGTKVMVHKHEGHIQSR